MGNREPVLQRRLCSNSPCALCWWGVEGTLMVLWNLGVTTNGHNHLLHNLSSTKVLWRLGAGTGAAHGMVLLLEKLGLGRSPSVPPNWLCPSWQLLLLSPNSPPCFNIIIFKHPTSLHPWSGSTCSATGLSWLCNKRFPWNYRITGLGWKAP